MGFAGLVFLIVVGFIVAADLFAFHEMTPPFNRVNEHLPIVSFENGDTVYCRMRYCDFRFPLPKDGRIVQTNIESGGFDTINGSICVVGTNGGPVNIRDYATVLQEKRFHLDIADASCCAATNVPDVPYVVGHKVIHYPLFSSFSAGSENQDGGVLQIEVTDSVTQIRFSYFGDSY